MVIDGFRIDTPGAVFTVGTDALARHTSCVHVIESSPAGQASKEPLTDRINHAFGDLGIGDVHIMSAASFRLDGDDRTISRPEIEATTVSQNVWVSPVEAGMEPERLLAATLAAVAIVALPTQQPALRS